MSIGLWVSVRVWGMACVDGRKRSDGNDDDDWGLRERSQEKRRTLRHGVALYSEGGRDAGVHPEMGKVEKKKHKSAAVAAVALRS